jgi:hypothetical protein
MIMNYGLCNHHYPTASSVPGQDSMTSVALAYCRIVIGIAGPLSRYTASVEEKQSLNLKNGESAPFEPCHLLDDPYSWSKARTLPNSRFHNMMTTVAVVAAGVGFRPLANYPSN